jgi:hypothetical protein
MIFLGDMEHFIIKIELFKRHHTSAFQKKLKIFCQPKNNS